MTSHFSLNIKTLSKETNAVVLSIALAHFNEETTLNTMHLSLCTEEQSKFGRHIETERLHWWFNEFKFQGDVRPMPREYYPPRDAIRQLNRFIMNNGSIPPNADTAVNFIWMRGIQFDWAILENLSHQFEVGLSFRHNALRDQRTFCDDHVRHEPGKCRSAHYDAMYHAAQIRKTVHKTGQPLK